MSAKEYTGANDVQAKIANYKDDFRADAEKIHAAIMNAGVTLYPRLWYGMPGYATAKAGPVLVYFRKDLFISFGRTQFAHHDFDSDTHASTASWLFDDINDASLAKIAEIVRGAVQ